MSTRERPILFSGEMIRALLAGTKTQTRRVVKNAAPDGSVERWAFVEGMRLWVRETWYDDNALRTREPKPTAPDQYIEYRADHDCNNWEQGCPCNDGTGHSAWRPSIFMPRWASRITLEITAVRVERLQGISEDDARAEGMTGGCLATPVEQYEAIWTAINGKRPGCAWSDNPWVWALSFRRLTP